MKRLFSFRSLLLLAVGVFIILFLYRDKTPVVTGASAPVFHLLNDNGERHSLEDYRGKVVLLNFWATWCPPCLQEFPDLETLYRLLRDKGFVVIGINEEDSDFKKAREKVARFREALPFTFLVLYDTQGEAAENYGVSQLPVSYLISREGKVLERILGFRKWTTGSLFDKIKHIVEENEMHP